MLGLSGCESGQSFFAGFKKKERKELLFRLEQDTFVRA